MERVYISLKEAENLIFNKLIFIPKSRLEVIKAKDDLSIVIKVNIDKLFKIKNSHFCILSAAVLEYEIPKDEQSLFTSHFGVPKGLVKLAIRDYKDAKKNDQGINFPDEVKFDEEVTIFKHLRRGLVLNYGLCLGSSFFNNSSGDVINLINDFYKLNKFNLNFIKEVLSANFYPIKEKNDGEFYTEAFNRFNWLGAYIFTHLKGISGLSEEDQKEAKQWLINFKDKEDLESIKKAVKNIPDIFFENFEFLIGYYYAASFYEEADFEKNFNDVLVNQLQKVKLQNNGKIIFWSIFFQAIFKDKLDFQYIIPSAQEELYNIEKNLVSLLLPETNTDISKSKVIKLDKEQAIGEYLMLKNGGKLYLPELINLDELKHIFENNINHKKINNIGFEENIPYLTNIFSINTCKIQNSRFKLKLKDKPKNITFYIKSNSKSKDWLKELKIKTKPISNIIAKNKKALVGFLTPEKYDSSFFKLYELLLKSDIENNPFQTVVFTLLVNEKVEYVQSPEFQNKKIKMETFCKERFGVNTTVLVKNEAVKSDNEIKRNLKHLLEGYRLEEIELIDENIEDRNLEWLLSTNKKYYMESLIDNPYVVTNQ